MGSRKAGESDTNQSLLIGDDLLIEILTRIPTPVVAVRCKLVSKHWCSLISSPFFIRRFKQQHMKHPKPLSGILANTAPRLDIGDSDDFNFRGFSLDYLPAKNENMAVGASCDDLIICRERKHDFRDPYSSEWDYYLCNPFTMQWAAIPRPTPPPRPRWLCFRAGLVCKPGDRFRCRIVFFYKESDPLETLYHVVIYCWETGEWIRYDDDRGKEYSVEASTVAAYNGKLHWITRDGQYLVTLDPFDMRRTSLRFINDANNDGSWSVVYYVGECEGVLRVVRLEFRREEGQRTSKGITVWELQEDDEHDQDAKRLIFKDHIVLSGLKKFIERVGFHPRNRDVLFWKIGDSIASFNTKSRELKVETQFKSGCSFPCLWTLQLPWWPTLIEGFEEAGSSPI